MERRNGTLRQQRGRCYRRQNKFAKVWEQTKVTTRLVMSYILTGFGSIAASKPLLHSEQD
jgi:hypothetical protein